MTTDIIFIGIIIIYAIIGGCRGCIRSLGGLIATVISWFISGTLAMPITVKLFEMFNIEPLISEMINTFSSGFYSSSDVVNNSLSSLDGFININRINITGPANTLMQSVSGIFDTTAINVASLFIMLIIFALCMFICRAVIHIFESAFNKIPLGKTMNMIFGIMCGMIKGFIVALIVYFIMMLINIIFKANIPISSSLFSSVMQMISGFGIIQ